jgi:hypothetical protein
MSSLFSLPELVRTMQSRAACNRISWLLMSMGVGAMRIEPGRLRLGVKDLLFTMVLPRAFSGHQQDITEPVGRV